MTADTPRTDFHTLTDNHKPGRPKVLVEGYPVVTAGFAASLERENNRLRLQLEKTAAMLRGIGRDEWAESL